jgi:hypothetical protein
MLAEKLKPPNPLPVVLACTDSHHLGAPADNVRRDAVVFSTVTFGIVLTMSTQTTFACHQRDLRQTLDAQDQNTPGNCPPCAGGTPPSSAGSQG